eukprot:5146676-Prymnesium_polylepis.1
MHQFRRCHHPHPLGCTSYAHRLPTRRRFGGQAATGVLPSWLNLILRDDSIGAVAVLDAFESSL